jgi:hypothetical protein
MEKCVGSALGGFQPECSTEYRSICDIVGGWDLNRGHCCPAGAKPSSKMRSARAGEAL